MYKEMWEALENILNTLVPSTTLKTVVNYDLKQYEWFPVATIAPIEWDSSFSDQANSELITKMRIRLVDQNKEIANLEPRMRQLVDEIINELLKKSNASLEWSVCSFNIVVSWWWLDDQFPTRTCDIIVEWKEYISII